MRRWKPRLLAAALVVLAACIGGLPHSLRKDIAIESDKLREAEHEFQHAQDTLRQDLAQAPDLFRDIPEPNEWTTQLETARENLDSAERDEKELEDLNRRNRASSRRHAEMLLTAERNLRETAAKDTRTVEASVTKWLDFGRNPAPHLAQMKREYDAIRAADLTSVSKTVEQAEHDWPAKKSALDGRLAALCDIPKQAEAQWMSTEAARQSAEQGKLTGPQVATLIQADDALSAEATGINAKADELRGLSGQLYYSWDKILTDLDTDHYGSGRIYRERIKTVRTHFIDVPAKKTEVSSDEHWVTVSEAAYHAVENDLGMAIAHKDAGLFDSEAQTTPQPAGFAYIAPESQGSNQYGYWTHSGGQSVWTWLPEYLILRDLLWNHDYRPVILDEYRGYRTAQQSGRTYYGQSTPTAPPQYGTHGTFTQTHYADSRYVQKGGFKGSAYASHNTPGGTSIFSGSRPEPRGGFESGEKGAGRQFGRGAGSPSGKRFGSPGGFRSPGRRFGRR
jgi:hypothetical protein